MSTAISNRGDIFELQLVRQDILSDVLFLIGTLISIYQNKEAEQKIINPGSNQSLGTNSASSDNVPSGFGLIVLVLFLLGTGIITYTGTERLKRQKAEAVDRANQTTESNIKGTETIILGQLIRIIGYLISIWGNLI